MNTLLVIFHFMWLHLLTIVFILFFFLFSLFFFENFINVHLGTFLMA